MKVVKRNISELIAAEYNPRQLTEKQQQDLTDSLKRFGMVDPIIVNRHPERNNIVVGGHMRLRCWQALGNKTIATVEVELDRDKERELNIRLNRNSGEWDWDLLANDFDVDELTDWGFDENELQCFDVDFGDADDADAEPQVDRAEELNEKWKVKPGDLWLLGEHRLLCGDATNAADVKRLAGGVVNAGSFSDPPFDLTDVSWIANLIDTFKGHHFICNSERPIIDAGAQYSQHFVRLFAVDFRRAYLVSNAAPMSRVDFVLELRNNEKANFQNCKDGFSTLIECAKLHSDKEPHKHMKKVELPSAFIKHYSESGAVFVDMFLGSGTTMVAAQNLGRKCYGIEIDPGYCAVILQRMQDAFPDIEIRKG
jgi:hypothetical protein